MPESLGFPKSYRLLSSSEFSPVFDSPNFKVFHDNFLLLAKYNGLDHCRLGIVVGKKNVRRAVGRNLIKRQIRESFRHKHHHMQSIDAIVLARRGSDVLSPNDLRTILDSLWNRAAKKMKKPR